MRTAAILGLVAAAVVLLALTCCGGSSFSSSGDAGDVADSRVISDGLLEQVSADAAPDDAHQVLDAKAPEVGADAPADVANDMCSPAALHMPPGCQCEAPPQGNCGADPRGCVWIAGSSSTCASSCWLYPVPGSGSCEACSSSWTCACIAPLLEDAGIGQCQCVDGPSGPYLGGC